MNKKYIIRKNEEIEVIVKTGKKSVSKYFVIYYIENSNSFNQYCISVSKKIGKAHVRNKIKRRIKDILMKNKMDLSKKCVIIVRKEAICVSYSQLQEVLLKQMKGEIK